MSFKSISSYSEFCNATRHKNRYIHCNGVTSFLKAVLETSKERERIIDKDIFFWRAQLGNDWQPIFHEGEEVDSQPSPYKPERMKPIPNSAT